VGFRVLTIDTTNVADVRRAPDALAQEELELFHNSLKPGRTPEDLLFQVLLDWGLELSMAIARDTVDGRELLVVDGGALIACFDDEVSSTVVRDIAKRGPLRAVFRDSGFGSDADRINAQQIFAEVSPATDLKVI
jgi:adenine-specific DNA-methyltransferase